MTTLIQPLTELLDFQTSEYCPTFTLSTSEVPVDLNIDEIRESLRECGYDSFPEQGYFANGQSKIPVWNVKHTQAQTEKLVLDESEKQAIQELNQSAVRAGETYEGNMLGNFAHTRLIKAHLERVPAKVTTQVCLAVHGVLASYVLRTTHFAPLQMRQLALLSGCTVRQVSRAVSVLEEVGLWKMIAGGKQSTTNYWRTSGVRQFYPVFTKQGFDAIKALID